MWAWKIETLDPGVNATIEYSLEGLEKGDWKETEVFYRGAGDVIGANRLDEKILEELRRQEDSGTEPPVEDSGAESPAENSETDRNENESMEEEKEGAGWASNGTGQQTLGV